MASLLTQLPKPEEWLLIPCPPPAVSCRFLIVYWGRGSPGPWYSLVFESRVLSPVYGDSCLLPRICVRIKLNETVCITNPLVPDVLSMFSKRLFVRVFVFHLVILDSVLSYFIEARHVLSVSKTVVMPSVNVCRMA